MSGAPGYVNSCRNTTLENSKQDNTNQGPMKLLADYEQCVAQAEAAHVEPRCSTASFNNVQRTGITENENCKKAAECVIDTAATPR
jgi:hypothetical protein